MPWELKTFDKTFAFDDKSIEDDIHRAICCCYINMKFQYQTENISEQLLLRCHSLALFLH